MCLFKTWYGLSDYEVEYSVNDRISFSYFCGLNIDQVAPDHSTVSRFRKTMTDEGAYDNLFKLINKQLELHQIIVKKGANVDTSLIDSPLKPKEKIHTQNLMENICYNLYRSPGIIASRLIVKIKRK
jgi:IS5 family transposase